MKSYFPAQRNIGVLKRKTFNDLPQKVKRRKDSQWWIAIKWKESRVKNTLQSRKSGEQGSASIKGEEQWRRRNGKRLVEKTVRIIKERKLVSFKFSILYTRLLYTWYPLNLVSFTFVALFFLFFEGTYICCYNCECSYNCEKLG